MSVKVILMYVFLISGKTTLTLVCTYMKVSGLDLDSFIWPRPLKAVNLGADGRPYQLRSVIRSCNLSSVD